MLINSFYPYILLVIPFISVNMTYYVVRQYCSDFNRYQSPLPPYIFSIVWSILLPLVGLSWYLARGKHTHILYSFLTLFLCLYIPLSLCLRLNNFFLLLFLRLFTVFVLFMLYKRKAWKSIWTLFPLLLWLTVVKVSIVYQLMN